MNSTSIRDRLALEARQALAQYRGMRHVAEFQKQHPDEAIVVVPFTRAEARVVSAFLRTSAGGNRRLWGIAERLRRVAE